MTRYPETYNPILEYWAAIQSGRETVSLKVQKTYRHVVAQLENADSEFYYSPRRANHVLEFFENYCHHSKGKAGLLLGTALLAVLLNSDFLLFVLGLEVLLLPAAGWTAARLAKKVRVRVVIPESRVFQGETFQIQAELENQSILPIAQASVRLAVRAYPEQEALLLTGKLFLNGGEQGSLCFRLEGSHCTSLEIQPDRLTITDPLGLFQRRCPVDSRESGMVFILPGVLRQETKLPEGQGELLSADGDSDRREIDSPDPSELRTFQNGVHVAPPRDVFIRARHLLPCKIIGTSQSCDVCFLNQTERAYQRQGVMFHFQPWRHGVERALVRQIH